MATGLPVVYARSGGVPELVADEAGIGVPHPDSFERDEPPEAEELAEAVSRVLADLPAYRDGRGARGRGFALTPRLDRHAEIFARLAPRAAYGRGRSQAGTGLIAVETQGRHERAAERRTSMRATTRAG